MTTVAKGDAVLVYPPYSCGLCVRVPPRERHALRAPRVHRPVGRRRLRRATFSSPSARSSGSRPGVAPVDVAPHADAGITAYHAVQRLAHLAVPGHDRGRDRRRRGRPHRAAAAARARIERRDRSGHGRAAAGSSPRSSGPTRWSTAGTPSGGSRANRRPRRRHRARLRWHGFDTRRLGSRCSRAGARTRCRLRRHAVDLRRLRGRRRASIAWSATSSAAGSTSGS